MNIPYYKQQTKYTCGPTAMRMVLASLGIKRTEQQLAKMMKTNKKIGTWHKYIPFVAEKYKLDYIVRRDGNIKELKKLFRQGWRIIVCYRQDGDPHYAVVKNINWVKIHLLDPHGNQNEKHLLHTFKKIWYDGESKRPWMAAIKKSKPHKYIHIEE